LANRRPPQKINIASLLFPPGEASDREINLSGIKRTGRGQVSKRI
jgi:hypothetical protein